MTRMKTFENGLISPILSETGFQNENVSESENVLENENETENGFSTESESVPWTVPDFLLQSQLRELERGELHPFCNTDMGTAKYKIKKERINKDVTCCQRVHEKI